MTTRIDSWSKRVENIDNVTTSAFTEEKGQIIEEDYKNSLYHFKYILFCTEIYIYILKN